MDPDSNSLLFLILLAVLILCNAFFSMSEIAIIALNDNKLKRMAEEGHKRALILMRLIREPSKFLATIQVGVTLSGLLSSAVAADNFAGAIASNLHFTGIAMPVLRLFALIIITLLLSFVTIVLGELVPKRLAMKFSEPIAFAVAPVLRVIYLIEKPFVALLSASTNVIIRLFGINPNHDQNDVTEEEIRMMVDVGNESGGIEQSEKDMINNIFEFDDTTVDEVMTHRTELSAVQKNSSIDALVIQAIEDGYSRIPVYDDTIDTIIGIVYVKDLLRLIVADDEAVGQDITAFMREPYFVPETASCVQLFNQFKEKKVQVAIVVDEYGGTSGIVTMEDLLETIVGNMQDEYDNEEEDISRLSETVFTMDGSTSLDDVMHILNIQLTEESEYDTLGGLITEILERIPEEDEYPSLTIAGYEFTVTCMDERRISKVRVEKLADEE